MSELGGNARYQFYRTERWLGRLEAIYEGKHTFVGNSDDPLDHILAFFLNCYHIKDWLQNGPEWQDNVPKSIKHKAVEQFVNESTALCICADLCNGYKHFERDKTPRSGSMPGLHRTNFSVDDDGTKSFGYIFKTGRGNIDARQLAEECFEAWRKFIHESTPESLEELAKRNREYRVRKSCLSPVANR